MLWKETSTPLDAGGRYKKGAVWRKEENSTRPM